LTMNATSGEEAAATAATIAWDTPISIAGDVFAAATGILRVKACWTLLAADRVERRDMRRPAGR
jgi:hypothetical protein